MGAVSLEPRVLSVRHLGLSIGLTIEKERLVPGQTVILPRGLEGVVLIQGGGWGTLQKLVSGLLMLLDLNSRFSA